MSKNCFIFILICMLHPVFAHEAVYVCLSVQWFGNLVTMEWWNDLWLNEGFAKFMEFVSVDITYPELQVVRSEYRELTYILFKTYTLFYSHFLRLLSFSQDDSFLAKCFEAMEVDGLSSSHPVSTPVENPTQIQEMFDDVSYDKVCLILPHRTNHL